MSCVCLRKEKKIGRDKKGKWDKIGGKNLRHKAGSLSHPVRMYDIRVAALSIFHALFVVCSVCPCTYEDMDAYVRVHFAKTSIKFNQKRFRARSKCIWVESINVFQFFRSQTNYPVDFL